MSDQGRERTAPATAGWRWSLLLAGVTLAGFVLHEAAHWLAGSLLGYDMRMSLGRAWPAQGAFGSVGDETVVSAAGPTFTVVVAVVGTCIALVGKQVWAYTLVFSAVFMRAVAFGVSLFNPNDEARISVTLGWPWWVLPAFVVGLLLMLAVVDSRALRIGWKTHLVAYATGSVVIAAIILLDGQMPGMTGD